MPDTSQTKMETQKFESLLASGGDLLAEDKLEEARDVFEKALEVVPQSEKALGLLGLTQFRLSEFESASGVYQRLVEMNSEDASYRLNLGLVHLKLGRAALAIRELTKSQDLDPTQIRTVSYLGLAHARNGQYSQAYEAFLRAGESNLAQEMEQYLEADEREEIRIRVQSSAANIVVADDEKMFPDTDEKEGAAEPKPADEMSGSLTAEGIISRAVDVANPPARTEDLSEYLGSATGRSAPLGISEFSKRRLLRPEESRETLEIGAGGVLIAQVDGKLISRTQGVMISSGELGFEPATRRIRGHKSDEVFGTGQEKLFLVTGKGYMVASACGEVFAALKLDDDVLYLREEYLFAFEPKLRWENGRIPGSEFLVAQFRGEGCVAIRTPKALLSVRLSGERVLYVESDVIAGWIGKVVPRFVKPAAGGMSSTSFVECSGEGIVLMHDLQSFGKDGE